ncbi:D-arabinitol 4-dehydrogenase [Celerinatantimonas diazotrophica]|uniref:D-arabinitol 4-dehydrogenase n=1 Tax=Celerinatantimonas diazotrophica TaxID=412034 RepID=A0A4R1JLF6_9GAMM|nr:D-arabinitol 4-dehydrogenase [Celerinatantimonas diazotrophica]TCK51885.1 D-arabinitol 4-dehydrogenase [Celerinatantimonas diazotrophica]CAG9296422.1 Mannitol 2-dehydrogenase [Celerinatantimonas diazotrophica]
MKQQHLTWMHIGAGSFHRAHQAWYLNQLLSKGDDRWSIALGNIRDDATDLLNNLAHQHGEYVLETVTPAGKRAYEKIRSIRTIVPWDKQLSALTQQGSDPATRVISFTVTEGGYYLDTHFKLEAGNPDIKADLAGQATTIYGALSKILHQRMQLNSGKVTLLCCDNVRHNGERFHDGMIQFLETKGDQELLSWMNNNCTTPNTMVDRITPRPTADIAPRVKEALGIDDLAPVMGEAFIQWVIEDNFVAGRPALEKVDVEMVESVVPYEEAKIRILNASHSCIAWAGTLIGLNFIDESTRHQDIYKLAYEYISEDVIPSLTPCPLDLENYRDVVLDRFSNPYIKDTNQRVAADGFSKIPGMVTPTLDDCYNRGSVPKSATALPALFFLFMQRWHQGSLPYNYEDGILDEAAVHAMFNSPDPIAVYARDKKLFGLQANNADFEALLRQQIKQLRQWAHSHLSEPVA